MTGKLSEPKSLSRLLLAGALFLVACAPGFGVTSTYRDLKIEAPQVKVILGEKVTASGNVTVTTPELTLKAANVTLLLAASGEVSKAEAVGKVTFHITRTSPAGVLLNADGEGDKLIYLPGEKQATVTADDGKKAHVHSIEKLPLPAGATPGEARPVRITDIKAPTIIMNTADGSIDADGGVEITATLPEKTSPAPETPKTEPKKP
jgi:hypothetical protein